MPVPVALQSEELLCGRSKVGIASYNTAEEMNVRLLSLLCVVQVTASATS
jgi:hypothetical protein